MPDAVEPRKWISWTVVASSCYSGQGGFVPFFDFCAALLSIQIKKMAETLKSVSCPDHKKHNAKDLAPDKI